MQAVIEVNPKKLGGVPCFAGTRVPVAYLFIHMAHDGTVDSFVEDYNSVSRDLAVSFAQALGETLNEPKAVGNEKRLFGVADGMACSTRRPRRRSAPSGCDGGELIARRPSSPCTPRGPAIST